MLHSDKLDAIGPALLKVQEAVSGVEKNSSNPHFKSKYADLAATNAATREHLTANGVVVTQWPGAYDREQNKMNMTTVLLHAQSGQWMRETAEVPLTKADAQGYGSCCTYARRYALQAALGLSPEDDDGNAASRTPANQPGPVRVISDAQYAELQTLVQATSTDLEAFCKFYRCDALIRLPAERFDHAKAALERKLKDKAA